MYILYEVYVGTAISRVGGVDENRRVVTVLNRNICMSDKNHTAGGIETRSPSQKLEKRNFVASILP